MTERMVASIAADLRATGLPYSLAVEAADKLNELVALLAAAETDRDRLAVDLDEVRADEQRTTERLVDVAAERDRLAAAVDQLVPVVDAARAWYANGTDPDDQYHNRLLDAVEAFENGDPDRPTVRVLDGNLTATPASHVWTTTSPMGCVHCGISVYAAASTPDCLAGALSAAPTFAERRAARDPSVDHASHSMQWTGPCPECPSPRQEDSDG